MYSLCLQYGGDRTLHDGGERQVLVAGDVAMAVRIVAETTVLH